MSLMQKRLEKSANRIVKQLLEGAARANKVATAYNFVRDELDRIRSRELGYTQDEASRRNLHSEKRINFYHGNMEWREETDLACRIRGRIGAWLQNKRSDQEEARRYGINWNPRM